MDDSLKLNLDGLQLLVNLSLNIKNLLPVKYTLFFCKTDTCVKYPVKMHFFMLNVWG